MKRIPAETWQQIRTAYASGIGLRELARKMGIPAGTVLARSKREQWTRQIQDAKALVKTDGQSNAITVTQSAARTMAERGQRHVERMASITERGVGHVEAMEPDAILDRIDAVDKLDKVARRTFGIADELPPYVVNIALLSAASELRPPRSERALADNGEHD